MPRRAIDPPVKWAERSEAKRKRAGIDGQSLGYGTAFSAVVPSQRPVCDAHQSKVFGSGVPSCPPGPECLNAQHQAAWSVPPTPRLSVSPIHIAQQCGPLATYRWASCLSASAICGCITACRSDGWRADFIVRCRCFTDSGALVMAGRVGTQIASTGYCRPPAPQQGSAKRVGRCLGWRRSLGNPPSTSNGERSPASPDGEHWGSRLIQRNSPGFLSGRGLSWTG